MALIYAVLICVVVLIWWNRVDGSKLPPGPKGLPYIGVPYLLPPKRTWLKIQQWSQKYGPIFKFEIMGQNLVVVSSKEIAAELMNKRSAIYSSRPEFPAIPGSNHDMRYLPLLAAGDNHRRARRFAAHVLTKIPQSLLVQVTVRAAEDYIRALLQDPDNAKNLTELYCSRITTEISWGDASLETAKLNVDIAHDLLVQLSPGSALLSKLPFLGHLWNTLPDWLQPWKVQEIARARRERSFWDGGLVTSIPNEKFALLKESLGLDHGLTDDEAIRSVGMLTFVGSMLLATPIQMFLIAMCHHPEWQAKAAEEIDRVCDSLPTPKDLKNLPILRAIIREVHRWRPAVPMGSPHSSVRDDSYEGMFIPKGSTVLACNWLLERDPELYPDAESFRPERWLEPEWPTYKEPLTVFPQVKNHSGFGWSSRLCLGQDYTETVNTIMIGSLLATCKVSKRKDATGIIDIPTMDYEPYTIFVRPYPWKMNVEPRLK